MRVGTTNVEGRPERMRKVTGTPTLQLSAVRTMEEVAAAAVVAAVRFRRR
jgi:hypothetical protein